jgi:hypothetical protein
MSVTDELQAIMNGIQGVTPNDLQTIDQCAEYATKLSGWLAYANEQMAHAARALNIAKRDAYARLQQDFNEKGITLSPSLAKDYIKSMCSQQGFVFDMAERCSRTVVHTLDALRSILSAKKEEMQMMRYQPA